MTEIRIRPTDRIPSIIFDPTTGYICFEGKAIPENAVQYFRPIVDGLIEFVKDPTPEVAIDVKLMYINTASLNILLELFKEFEKPVLAGMSKVKLRWYCDPDDGDMEDCFKDASLYLSALECEIIFTEE